MWHIPSARTFVRGGGLCGLSVLRSACCITVSKMQKKIVDGLCLAVPTRTRLRTEFVPTLSLCLVCEGVLGRFGTWYLRVFPVVWLQLYHGYAHSRIPRGYPEAVNSFAACASSRHRSVLTGRCKTRRCLAIDSPRREAPLLDRAIGDIARSHIRQDRRASSVNGVAPDPQPTTLRV